MNRLLTLLLWLATTSCGRTEVFERQRLDAGAVVVDAGTGGCTCRQCHRSCLGEVAGCPEGWLCVADVPGGVCVPLCTDSACPAGAQCSTTLDCDVAYTVCR